MPLAVTMAEDGTPRWTGPAVIAGDLWERPAVTLRVRTLARRILHDGGRATGVEAVDLATGARQAIGARAVVVAGDAFRTPQLLWASGIRPAALGRYLNDQPQIMAAAVLDERYVPGDVEVPPDLLRSATEAPGGSTGLLSTVRLPPGNFGVGGRSIRGSDAEGGRSTAIVPVSGVSWVPYAADRPFHGQVMQLDASPVPLEGAVTVRPGQVVGLGWFCRKELSAGDRVWFDDGVVDRHGMPTIRVDYTLTPGDEAAIAAATEEIRRAAETLGRPLGEPFVLPAGSSLHYQGTTRMGPADDGTCVCDPTGRVWGTANVYVGGNNAIPTATACNPTLTAVALGILSARALLARLPADGATPAAEKVST